MKTYKISKFNYWTENNEGEMLLYNTFYESFIKVLSEDKENILSLFNRKKEIPENEIPKELIDAQYFVESTIDEDALLEQFFYNVIDNKELNITIFTTDQCNFRCKYCYEPYKNGSMSIEVQDKIIEFVKKNINKYQSLCVEWFGGEPLMGLDVIRRMSNEFIKICKFFKKPYFSSITTNGYLLTKEVFEELLTYRVFNYQITLDGYKNTHDTLRVLSNGEGTFDKIVNNLISIKENVKSHRFKITLRTNYTKSLYEHIDEYIDFLKSNFSSDSRFSFLARIVGDWGGDSVKKISKDLWNDPTMLDAIYLKYLNSDLSMNCDTLYNFIKPGAGVCYASKMNCFSIDTQGLIHKCQSAHQLERISDIGNVFINPAINYNDTAKWIARISNINDNCMNCYFLPVCLNGNCALKNYKKHYLNDSTILPTCPCEKYSINSILLLLDKGGYFSVLNQSKS